MMQVPTYDLDMSTRNRNSRRPIEQGPTGRTVARNLARIRKQAGVTAEQLVNALSEVGHKMPRTAISDIEGGHRRVNVDELVALSVVLKVNPNALLLPDYAGEVDQSDEVTAVTQETSGEEVWAWGDGWDALPQHKVNAPSVNEEAPPMERGRQRARHNRIAHGLDFLDRVRPDGEISDSREFLSAVHSQVGSMGPTEWLSIWKHDAHENASYRVSAYPEGGWSDMRDYFERMRLEISGINNSTEARYLRQLDPEKSHGND
ncbi:hypothetical protein [Citricoccus sp. NR2]|uniref:hypothetical protein n=1 Tax=Citricoccus sp. NR2 TaxID=3004095 RepID=UPI0022DD1177|nr:hypothetical protein [Citricoccus sp. NR2]WBL19198.1 hypothetical protein O1A05_00375 [Citricoccus sp. NR2]